LCFSRKGITDKERSEHLSFMQYSIACPLTQTPFTTLRSRKLKPYILNQTKFPLQHHSNPSKSKSKSNPSTQELTPPLPHPLPQNIHIIQPRTLTTIRPHIHIRLAPPHERALARIALVFHIRALPLEPHLSVRPSVTE
jgi:hypothetical protein